jgi:hypothetical protein
MDHLPAYEDCISRVRYILSTGWRLCGH